LFIIACIPAYNEERNIAKTIRNVAKFVNQVIVCDDGSTDNTVSEAENTGAYVIKLQKNAGKGAALKEIFKFAKSSNIDIMITIDADGQFVPEEIPLLLKPIIEKKSDIVVGYRFDDKTEMPKYRKIGNKFLDKITNLAENIGVRDTQSGFRSYSKKAVEIINFKADGFGADSEILIDAIQKKLKISEEKVTVIYNTGGRTSTKNPISHTVEVITSVVEKIALKHPLKYIGIPGIVLIFTSIIFGINLTTMFNETGYFSIPITFIVLGTLVVGVMMILMSILLYSVGMNRINSRN
jgi:glycosyltransferase involved in cell wall biosynthesis|tara:strand:+ start:554 stop:1438 length:885 start_codon:yes stop_codon:yes gene_type:complete